MSCELKEIAVERKQLWGFCNCWCKGDMAKAPEQHAKDCPVHQLQMA
jgi:hypothetical protein